MLLHPLWICLSDKHWNLSFPILFVESAVLVIRSRTTGDGAHGSFHSWIWLQFEVNEESFSTESQMKRIITKIIAYCRWEVLNIMSECGSEELPVVLLVEEGTASVSGHLIPYSFLISTSNPKCELATSTN